MPIIESKTHVERFWKHVERTDGCWKWTASLSRGGYGNFNKHDGQRVYAHRYSWELHNGPIPRDLCVLHRCDNPICCNPAHLFLGTHADNVRDRVNKGRSAVKLSAQQVAEIRRLHAVGIPVCELGRRFDIVHGHVRAIVTRRIWKIEESK